MQDEGECICGVVCRRILRDLLGWEPRGRSSIALAGGLLWPVLPSRRTTGVGGAPTADNRRGDGAVLTMHLKPQTPNMQPNEHRCDRAIHSKSKPHRGNPGAALKLRSARGAWQATWVQHGRTLPEASPP